MSLSAARAAWLYNAANIMLIASLVGGVIATVLIVWMGNVKEQYANADANALKAQIAQADARAADANARAAEANRIAEEERLARAKIEAGLASRRLGPEQMSRLASTLRTAARTPASVNVTMLGDQEAHTFGADLIRAIQSAGIQVNVAEVGAMAPPPYGLFVTDTPTEALKGALDAAGVSAQYNPEPSAVPSILVGLKPPPF